jgi:uncharacterized protein DUF6458
VGYLSAMGIGTSILLIAVGAILRYAITAHVAGVKVDVVGLILMIVGILGLIVSLLYVFAWSDRRRGYAVEDRPYDPRYPPRDRY